MKVTWNVGMDVGNCNLSFYRIWGEIKKDRLFRGGLFLK
jgi:hypothetical protein